MTMEYYVDAAGKYIGAFEGSVPAGGVLLPAGQVPIHSDQHWNGTSFDPYVPPVVILPLTAEEIYDILETKGVLLPADRPRPKPPQVP